jgi:antirestriction protein ArdC
MNTHNLNTSADLKARITKRIQELAQATDTARVSEEMLRYLDMCSKFHQYSPCNVWLILMSQPNASYVAGFKKWKSMGRFVRNGEHGIPILAPIISTLTNDKGEEEQRLVGFKIVYVFDVCQTDGEPLPEPPDWKSPEKNAELQERLILLTQSKGIHVQIKRIGRDIQGVSLGGKIILDPEAGTKTLIHEIAHELLHHVEGVLTSSTTRELEAESVAYVVAKHFGMNCLSSPNYNALHGATAEVIMEHLEQIRNTAAKIISTLESGPELIF